jgi:hypothetical protein
MDAVAAIQAVADAFVVAPSGTGGEIETQLVQARLGKGKRLIRRAKHASEHVGNFLLVGFIGFIGNHRHHVQLEARRRSLFAAAGVKECNRGSN